MPRSRKTSISWTSATGLILLFCIVAVWLVQKSPPVTPIEIRQLPKNFNAHGIDVSRYQGTIDWDTFFQHMDTTIEFVYCKATEGTDHVDIQWDRNRRELQERSKPFGAYHFFLPEKDPVSQAEHFVSQCQQGLGNLPPVLDAEVVGTSGESLILNMKTWLQTVERKTGKRPLIYTSYAIYKNLFSGNFEGYRYWVANYNVLDKEHRFSNSEIVIWQYSDKGKLPGIETLVDLNFAKPSF